MKDNELNKEKYNQSEVCMCTYIHTCTVLSVLSRSIVSHSLRPHGDSPGKNTGVGFLCPSPGDLPNPETEPRSPTLKADSSPSEPPAYFAIKKKKKHLKKIGARLYYNLRSSEWDVDCFHILLNKGFMQ